MIPGKGTGVWNLELTHFAIYLEVQQRRLFDSKSLTANLFYKKDCKTIFLDCGSMIWKNEV